MEPTDPTLPPLRTRSDRNPLIAALLSFLILGLGQLYNGQLKKALLFRILLIVLFLLWRQSGAEKDFIILVIASSCLLLFRLYAILDAYLHAKRQKGYVLKAYNKGYYYVLFSVLSSVASQYGIYAITDSQGGPLTYTVTDIANQPTLLEGDLIVVDKKAYKNQAPDYGDIVMISTNENSLSIFRIVGLPGDRLKLNQHLLSVNEIPCKATLKTVLTEDYVTVEAMEEMLPNGHRHQIYRNQFIPDEELLDTLRVEVPENSYFVLGDNRSSAMDSRYIGLISLEDIQGRLRYTVLNTKRFNRIHVDLTRQ